MAETSPKTGQAPEGNILDPDVVAEMVETSEVNEDTNDLAVKVDPWIWPAVIAIPVAIGILVYLRIGRHRKPC